MTDEVTRTKSEYFYRFSINAWLVIVAALLLMFAIFYSGIEHTVYRWNNSEEYGYGYLIPLITIFFIWQRKDAMDRLPFSGSWLGVLLLLSGVFLYVLGELSSLYILIQYAFLITLYGLILALVGLRAFQIIWVSLFFLIFMIPLPGFLYQGLSTQLQLISSEIGVAFIRLFGLSVYLEGNVIDLGSYKLQVVEACSGLRYLFPLAALGFMAAYIYKASFWKRAVLFLSTIPITVLMNSIRIGVIGVLVDKWGVTQAEGFLHYFEGWIIFMACMVVLLLEMWLLTKISGHGEKLGDLFAIEFPYKRPVDNSTTLRSLPATFNISLMLLVTTVIASQFIGNRQEVYPERQLFSEFPLKINTWNGKKSSLEPIVLGALKLDDYIIGDFKNDAGENINFYSAYYASQSKGESAHSPRSCIPGGGWQIKDLSQKSLDGVLVGGIPVTVNRLVIAKGDYKQLVYYWFQGRNRIITNEYMVKWFLFWDALTKNRTDGALVRLTAFLEPSEDISDADKRLTLFANDVSSHLADYIPN